MRQQLNERSVSPTGAICTKCSNTQSWLPPRRVSLKLRRWPDSSWRRVKAEKIRDFNRDGAFRQSSDDSASLKNSSSDIVPPPLEVIPRSREQSFDCLLGPPGPERDLSHRDFLPIAPQQKEGVVFGKVSQHLLGPFFQTLSVKLFIEISTCKIDRLYL